MQNACHFSEQFGINFLYLYLDLNSEGYGYKILWNFGFFPFLLAFRKA